MPPVILSFARTPLSPTSIPAAHLVKAVVAGAMARAGLDEGEINTVIVGEKFPGSLHEIAAKRIAGKRNPHPLS